MTFVNDDNEILEFDGEFAMSKQSVSFFEFALKGDVSINFNVLNNSVNRKVLGYYGPQMADGGVFITREFTLVKNGNNLVRGTIIIQRDLGKELDCYFASGNANWFGLLQFSCKDVRNTKYNQDWTSASVIAQKSATEGICFPIIDYFFQGQKFDRYFMRGLLSIDGAQNALTGYADVYPCVFLHTLIEEIAKYAEIKIVGTLMNDPFYKSLVITCSGPDLIEPSTGAAIYANPIASATPTDDLTIGAVAPEMKAIDLVKWASVSFGCIPTYDIYSKSLSLDLTNKMKLEVAQDWSEFVTDYTMDYDRIVQHNYIKLKQAQDTGIVAYNAGNSLVKWGELDIESTKEDDSSKTLYSSPFTSVKDLIGTTQLGWGTTDMQFFKLTDGKYYPYTSVTNIGGKPRFDGVFTTYDTVRNGTIAKIVDATGYNYDGYHYSDFVNGNGPTTFYSDAEYPIGGAGTGNLFIQSMSKVNPGPRVLSFVPNYDVTKFQSHADIAVGATTGITTIGYAYSSKVTGFAGDPIKKAVNYGEINLTGYTGITLDESYYNMIRKCVVQPYIRSRMFLPLSKFANYNGSQIIFLKCMDLIGYFFVESVQNYVDSNTEVEVNLYFLNG